MYLVGRKSFTLNLLKMLKRAKEFKDVRHDLIKKNWSMNLSILN